MLKPQSFWTNSGRNSPFSSKNRLKFAKSHKNSNSFSKNLPKFLWTNRSFLSSLVYGWIPLIPWSPAAWATPWNAFVPGRPREASGSCRRAPNGWRSRCHLHLGHGDTRKIGQAAASCKVKQRDKKVSGGFQEKDGPMIGNATMDIVKTAGQKMVRSFFELMSLSLGSRKRGKIEGSEGTKHSVAWSTKLVYCWEPDSGVSCQGSIVRNPRV